MANHNVTIAPGVRAIQMPNGKVYDEGDPVVLNENDYVTILPLIYKGIILDSGKTPAPVSETGKPDITEEQLPTWLQALNTDLSPTRSDQFNLIAIGDSLVAGQQDRVGDNWPELVEAAMGSGVIVINHGNPAWTSTELAIFHGAKDLVVGAFTIPASVTAQAFTVTSPAGDWTPGGGNGTYVWVGTLAGIAGIVRRNPNTAAWTFTRMIAGSSTPVPDGATFHCTNADLYRKATTLIMVGRNNYANQSTVLADIDSIIATLTPQNKRYLVISVLTAADEVSGSLAYTRVTSLNSAMASRYGSQYLDARSSMVANGLTLNGLTATGADTTALTGDTIPPALMMADLIHPNRYGVRAIASAVVGKLADLDWLPKGVGTIPAWPAQNLWYSNRFKNASFVSTGTAATYASNYRSHNAGRTSQWGYRSRFFATSSGTINWLFFFPGNLTVPKSGSVWIRSSVASSFRLRVEGYTSGGAFVAGDFAAAYTSVPANTWTRIDAPSITTGASVTDIHATLESTTVFNAGDIVDIADFTYVSGTQTPAAPPVLGALVIAESLPVISPGIVNTVAETAMFGFTIPGGLIQPGDVLMLESVWDVVNGTGGAVAHTYRYKLGGTTLFAPAPSYGTNGTNRFEVVSRVSISVAALNDQRWVLDQLCSGAVAPATGVAAQNTANSFVGNNTSTEDLTTDKLLTLTVQMGSASATADCRLKHAVLRRQTAA